jgi:Protein of unknown function (DUF1566)
MHNKKIRIFYWIKISIFILIIFCTTNSFANPDYNNANSALNSTYSRKVIGGGDCKTVRRQIVIDGNYIGIDIDKPMGNCSFSKLYLIIDDMVIEGPDKKTIESEDYSLNGNGSYVWVERNGYIYFRLSDYQKKRLLSGVAFKQVGLYAGNKQSTLTDDGFHSIDLIKLMKFSDASQLLASDIATPLLFKQHLDLGQPILADELTRRCKESKTKCELNTFEIPSTGVFWRICAVGQDFNLQKSFCEGRPLQLNWLNAIKKIRELNKTGYEGHNDWRLPSSNELRQLIQNYPVGKYQGDLRIGDNQCKIANDIVNTSLSRFNPHYDFLESFHWMADNSDLQNFQSPFAINLKDSFGMLYQGFCNVHSQAFRGFASFQIRPHASLPFILVRGGNEQGAWNQALDATNLKADLIIKVSQDRGNAEVSALNDKIGKSVTFLREAVQGSQEKLSSSNSGAPWTIVSSKAISSHGRILESRVKCLKGSSYRIGTEHTIWTRNDGGVEVSVGVGYIKQNNFTKGANFACEIDS